MCTSSSQRQRPLNMVMKCSVLSLPKATPLAKTSKLASGLVPFVPADMLVIPNKSIEIGSGRFGSCSRRIFKDSFDVCVKEFSSLMSLEAIKSEAEIMFMLNGGDYTPHCFGVCLEMRAIVMSNITVENRQISLHVALGAADIEGFSLSADSSKDCIINICNGLTYIHKMNVLHNDLKLDNIVLGTTYSGCLKAYIVDFGKACISQHAKKYHLSEDEKAVYKKEHTQIAPDVRDGLVAQSTQSDIYSLGRILKKVNSRVMKSTKLTEIVKQCLSYHGHNRPSIDCIMLSVLK